MTPSDLQRTGGSVIPYLSYSSGGVLQSCMFKYFLSKIKKVPADPDAVVDTDAFRFGKAFHLVMEKSLHDFTKFDMNAHFEFACKAESIAPEVRYPLFAAVDEYYFMHQQSKLQVVACEVAVSAPGCYMIVDAIMIEPKSGRWWIVDLKTSGQVYQNLFAKLHADYQLNLYASYIPELLQVLAAKGIKLAAEDFAGTRYRVAEKLKIVPKSNESLYDYSARVNKKVYDVAIPVERMTHTKEVRETHDALLRLARDIEAGKTKPLKNRNSCLSWNKPCEFWSHCYGQCYTACQMQACVSTSQNMVEVDSASESFDFL